MRDGESHHDFWLRTIREMGGEGVFPKTPEPLPEVGAKFPLMVKNGETEMVVYDEEELANAVKLSFSNPALGIGKQQVKIDEEVGFDEVGVRVE